MYIILTNKIMAKVIIITGPSGVGKGTIEKELFADSSLNLTFSISATTRERREKEMDGVHYFFITKKQFEQKIEDNEFIEYSKHFDNYYGTLKSEIQNKLNESKNVLVEVETTGAINIISQYKQNKNEDELITIFIVPPSIEELKSRILNRNSENRRAIRKRLKKAKKELEYKKYFNHVIKNDNIKEAITQIKEIIMKEC